MHKPAHHAPILMQAPVRALDPDGAAIITFGTVAFAVTAAVCWFRLDALVAAGQGWWFGVSVAGFVIGVVGSAISWTRHRHRKGHASAQTGEDTPDREPVEPPLTG